MDRPQKLSWLAAVGCALITVAAVAWAPRGTQPVVEVEVLTDDGRSLRRFPLPATGAADLARAYLEAERGAGYRLRVHNRTGSRVGLVIAVDGRNIIDGARSELARTEPMYVLEPRGTGEYDGWRTAHDRVHRFYFTDADSSYAGAFGDRSAMGVIAVAAYREKRPEPRLGLSAPGEQAAPAGPGRRSRDAAAPEPGTGFGEQRYSPTVRVRFEPEHAPASRLFLKYEWTETLVRMGYLPAPPRGNRFWPAPGQGDPPQGFAPYPPAR